MPRSTMLRFAQWHIWLGWLVGVPILMWTVSGLVMVAKPITEVRDGNLRLPTPEAEQILPADTNIAVALPGDASRPVKSVTTAMQQGRAVTTIAYMDGTLERYDADGTALGPLSEIEARQMVAAGIKGGDKVISSTAFAADDVPFDFRRPMDVWQVTLEDDTNVYVGQHTGKIEAVRTSWWRLFDFMWGLHIMDLQEREDTSHPILILFAALAVIGALLGCILMFRRRKPKVAT
ncbi:PepSY domain-containing protein [Parerythrobacter jejuensis]|uniref:PepSY domain-containing protein n=1 Tax=Parerythrobacter jejuensis TaxID=795812 RepID=A0A845B155_9SPHN|nr:PepSY domain-containing protein [Parerythrobacter jejuensis]MXP32718.1 hypothetical protein [Parerythrobacter jejuensis]